MITPSPRVPSTCSSGSGYGAEPTRQTRVEARQDVFDYIEMFYNPKRKHVRNRILSPVEFEQQQKPKTEGV